MGLDKLVDGKRLDSRLTDIANSLRKKINSEEGLAFPSGFSATIDKLAPTSDSRIVYQGHRPLTWEKLPDYNQISKESIVFLMKLNPGEEGLINFLVQFNGRAKIEAGKTVEGRFVSFGASEVEGSGQIMELKHIFRFEDYPDLPVIDGSRQIVVQISFSNPVSWNFGGTVVAANKNILDIIVNVSGAPLSGCICTSCQFYYTFNDRVPSTWFPAKYIQTATNTINKEDMKHLADIQYENGVFIPKSY